MKTQLVSLKLAIWALAAISGVVLPGCVQHTTTDVNTQKVAFEENAVLIPGTAITKADQETMNSILGQYDKSLYKVQTYEKGGLVVTRGSLSDKIIKTGSAERIAENAKAKSLTGCALQIGFDTGSHYIWHTPSPSPQGDEATNAIGTHLLNPKPSEIAQSQQLVAKVTPILEKYR